MSKTVAGGPFPMVVERDGTAHHAVTGDEVFYCLRCPFGTKDAMFLTFDELHTHEREAHPDSPPIQLDPPKRKRGRPPKVKNGNAR